jgi:hypothetical protein
MPTRPVFCSDRMRLFPENMFQSSMLQALRILSCQIGDFALRSLVLIMCSDVSRH